MNDLYLSLIAPRTNEFKHSLYSLMYTAIESGLDADYEAAFAALESELEVTAKNSFDGYMKRGSEELVREALSLEIKAKMGALKAIRSNDPEDWAKIPYSNLGYPLRRLSDFWDGDMILWRSSELCYKLQNLCIERARELQSR